MASFFNRKIQDTYQWILQIEEGVVQDGLGNVVNPLQTTASYALTSSYVKEASTASYVLPLAQPRVRMFGDLEVDGAITASVFITEYVTSSVSVITGSTKFGSILENTHQFTGSVSITGSLTADNITGSLYGTASWAQNGSTASYITSSNVWGPFGSGSIETASFATTASFVTASGVWGPFGTSSITSASLATTASFVTSSNVWGPFGSGSVVTASYATTASYYSGIYTATITPSTASWIITHNLGTEFPIVQIWDTGSKSVMQPNTIQSISADKLKVTFTTPKSGVIRIL